MQIKPVVRAGMLSGRVFTECYQGPGFNFQHTQEKERRNAEGGEMGHGEEE